MSTCNKSYTPRFSELNDYTTSRSSSLAKSYDPRMVTLG